MALYSWTEAIKRASCLFVAAMLLTAGRGAAAQEGSAGAATIAPLAGEWRELFNGTDLTGWKAVIRGETLGEDAKKVFQVKDGAIHVYADGEDGADMPFGFIVTENEYASYDLSVDYQWGTKRFGSRKARPRDSGVLYHIADAMEKMAVWPHSIECQIQEGDVGDIYAVKTKAISPTLTDDGNTSRTYAPEGKPANYGGVTEKGGQVRDARLRHNRMAERDGWNTIEIRVRGDRGVHIVNGIQNNAWSDLLQQNPEKMEEWIPLVKGRILLQAEGAEILFKNVKIREAKE